MSSHLHPTIQIDGSYQRLEYVRHQRRWYRQVGTHSLAENQTFLQSQPVADSSTGLAAHHDRLDFRQIPFQVVGEFAKEQLADNKAQHGIAEKFQPFVTG